MSQGFCEGLWKNLQAIKLGKDGGIEAPARADGERDSHRGRRGRECDPGRAPSGHTCPGLDEDPAASPLSQTLTRAGLLESAVQSRPLDRPR